jgi:hypothetical protein
MQRLECSWSKRGEVGCILGVHCSWDAEAGPPRLAPPRSVIRRSKLGTPAHLRAAPLSSSRSLLGGGGGGGVALVVALVAASACRQCSNNVKGAL